MEFREIFTNSSNEVFTKNDELLEEYELLNLFGSPNKEFLKFLNSKKLSIIEDEITPDLIEEFKASRRLKCMFYIK